MIWIGILSWILVLYGLPVLITRYLMKKYYPQDFEGPFSDIYIYMPILNIISVFSTCIEVMNDKKARKQAAQKERIKKRIKHMETFLRYHGYTWDDVDEFVDSLGVVEKFLEGEKNGSI